MDLPVPGSPGRFEAPEPHSLELLQRAQAGDAAALDRLCARYLAPLRRWTRGRLPARARGLVDTDDLVQETITRALGHIEEFEPRHPGALLAYLRQAVTNRVRDEIRRAERTPARAEAGDDLVDGMASPLEALIGREALARYELALQRLADEERAAVIARVEMRASYAQIASELGKPSPDAARMMVSRALLRLAEEMADGA